MFSALNLSAKLRTEAKEAKSSSSMVKFRGCQRPFHATKMTLSAPTAFNYRIIFIFKENRKTGTQ